MDGQINLGSITQLAYECALCDVTKAPPADSKLVLEKKAEASAGAPLDKIIRNRATIRDRARLDVIGRISDKYRRKRCCKRSK
jgi:hypothetical protein